jgi:hypothetical protein
MTKTEAQKAFPIDTLVKVNSAGQTGRVIGHPTYLVAMLGLRTYIEVSAPDSNSWTGEYVASDLEVMA